MSKTLLSSVLLFILIGAFVLAGSVRFGKAQSGTIVNGIITSNTTWTYVNSPYSLSGPVAVNTGVTLTIEPGATVNLGSYYIQIKGTLIAIGTNTSKIQFIGGQIQFTAESAGWTQSTGSGSIISHARITGFVSITSSSPMISESYLTSNTGSDGYPLEINGGSPIISGNNFQSMEYSDRYGRLQATTTGLSVGGDALITDNDFSVGPIVVGWGSPVIQRNLMEDGSNIEVNTNSLDTNPTIQNNTFQFCESAIAVGPTSTQLPIIISYNNFENSSEYNVYWGAPNNINAANNWWGTTDKGTINQSIYDFKNNFNSGAVNFVPFLVAPNPEAGLTASPPFASSTPSTPSSTPIQTSSPTLTQSQSPALSSSPSALLTQQPTATPQPSTGSSLPLELIVVVVTVVIIAVAIGAFLLGKRAGRKNAR